MAHVSADKELRITLLIDLDFQFKGEQLPNSSQINIINPSVVFPVGKLPSDASLKHFIEQFLRLCKTGNFNFDGFNFNFITTLFNLITSSMVEHLTNIKCDIWATLVSYPI